MTGLLRRAAQGVLSGLWLCLAVPAAQARNGGDEEALIKAAFVYNFAKFTRWPDGAVEAAGAPLTLCLAGEDELVDALDRLAGKTVKGRPLAVQAIKGGQVPRQCQMLYVAASEQRRQGDLVRPLQRQPILTISQLAGFARAGGVVELYREDGRIRFIINLAAARGAGLEISPNLLNLAVVIGQD